MVDPQEDKVQKKVKYPKSSPRRVWMLQSWTIRKTSIPGDPFKPLIIGVKNIIVICLSGKVPQGLRIGPSGFVLSSVSPYHLCDI
jgi:hypothetical protein